MSLLHVAYSSIFSLRCGCVVNYYCLWYISIHRGYTSNFTEGKGFPLGLFTWRKLARLTNAMGKGNFHIILFTKVFLSG